MRRSEPPEIRRDDEDLRASEERYRTFIEESPDGIWRLELDEPVSIALGEDEMIDHLYEHGRVAECNDAMARVHGVSRADEIAGARLDAVFDRSNPTNEACLRAFVRSGYDLLEAETTELDRRGNAKTLVNTIRGVVRGGCLERAWGTQRDVTRRKQTELALRESEQRYRELFDNANDIVFTHDLDGRFLSLNRAGERLLGYTREEALSMTVFDVVAPESRDLVQSVLVGRLAGAAQTAYDLEVEAKGGRRATIEVSSQLVWRHGRPSLVLSIARDVTERKELEEQFRQSQKMEAVGRLAGGVAHDFNNLLTIINGYTDLLLKQMPVDSPLREDAEEVRRAGERASALTRQLLTFSRKQAHQPRVIDLNRVVVDMERMLRRLIDQKVALDLDLDHGLPKVLVDGSQIEQVVLNLVVNARDAMPEGGRIRIQTSEAHLGELYARYHAGARPGNYAVLSVSDTGEGMDAETMQHIFEPFFTTKGKKGTGLGLSTVYGIVQQSGGHIRVESEPGRGTVFQVYIPAHGQPIVEPRPETGELVLPLTLRVPETILLVDDDEGVRRFMQAILEAGEYTVLVASGGDEALEICEQYEGRIHLLLTDVLMPHMSGPELHRRAAEIRPDMKVLFVSGYTDNVTVRQDVLENGGDFPFLEKPFTADVLERRVRQVLDG
jgi:PAS domain S-box-containing protein